MAEPDAAVHFYLAIEIIVAGRCFSLAVDPSYRAEHARLQAGWALRPNANTNFESVTGDACVLGSDVPPAGANRLRSRWSLPTRLAAWPRQWGLSHRRRNCRGRRGRTAAKATR
eukprot:CAMPEP_0203935598 /NCGR_PEP_ID=MMETSP0359-20131031/73313_1 /ASSEMBLY_ACC=CAM_ASM_000338 /TAXON_ID=268821 /ORGANISM="Scrippsiella Hangoei, Strain SHTV-5" /LENGTH=113 /DNA_ID=CAMNT_0050865467 /DNA_START=12 /DNA_END=354 /DNA_ORIENTATION=+